MIRRLLQRLRFVMIAALVALPAINVAAQATESRPYVVLVSLDGFRNDYAERYGAANLIAIGKAGATAAALIPEFPSFTFPNHISIVTGKYPGHHGIVTNSFYDPARKQFYDKSEAARDGSWYRAKPLWVVAEEQGVKSASQFWPSSDARVFDTRPSYWKKFDVSVPNEQRVSQVLDWLKLPPGERPHFITVYFGDVDADSHKFGPDSPETVAAVHRVDKMVGDLWNGIEALHLPVNLVVVSDHGMQRVDGFINLSEFADFTGMKVDAAGSLMLIYTRDSAETERTYRALKGKDARFEVYRRKETPPRWHFTSDPRIGDLVVAAKQPYVLGIRPRREGVVPSIGEHGFDPAEFPTMYGIFYAAGPNVKPGVKLPAFENVNVFPFITRILGLVNPPGLDGTGKVLEGAYRASSP